MSETWYPYTQEELVILSKLSGLELAAFLKERYARKWVLPANKTHILLGTPGLLDRHKTLVEPDGSFSPGVGTFGITVWLYHHRDGKLYVAEELPLDELSFTLAKGFLPVACSKWKAKEFCVKIRVFVGGQDNDETKVTDYAEVTVINEGKGSSDAWLYIAIRSLGPAGGPIKNIGYDADKKVVTVNSKPSVHFDIAPESFGATSFAHEEEDISTWARRGELPPLQEIEDSTGLGLAICAAASCRQSEDSWVAGLCGRGIVISRFQSRRCTTRNEKRNELVALTLTSNAIVHRKTFPTASLLCVYWLPVNPVS